MPADTASDPQMKQLVAYLSALGTAPANQSAAASSGTEPAAAKAAPTTGNPNLSVKTTKQVQTKPLSGEALRGEIVFQKTSCEACHGAGGLHGTVAAPGLAGTASMLPAPVLKNLLQLHSKQMKEGGMPLDNMNTQDLDAIVAHIRSMATPASSQ
jgi:mono/diheme cytochrome c family protein